MIILFFKFIFFKFINFQVCNFLQILMQSSNSPANNTQFQVLYKSKFANLHKNTFFSSLTLACQESGQRSPFISFTKFLKSFPSNAHLEEKERRQQLTVDVLDWKQFVRGVNDFDAAIGRQLPVLIEEAQNSM